MKLRIVLEVTIGDNRPPGTYTPRQIVSQYFCKEALATMAEDLNEACFDGGYFDHDATPSTGCTGVRRAGRIEEIPT